MLKINEKLLENLKAIAEQAGDFVLQSRPLAIAQALNKNDGSPVTLADIEAERMITFALKQIAPTVPVIGEEAVSEGRIPQGPLEQFFTIDPIDGTRSYIQGRDSFAVCIGLVQLGRPVVGIIHSPTQKSTWLGANDGAGLKLAKKFTPQLEQNISVAGQPKMGEALRAIANDFEKDPTTHNDTNKLLQAIPYTRLELSESALKYVQLAEGQHDIYPRGKGCMVWDIMPGQAILEPAGGSVVDAATGKPIRYHQPLQRTAPYIARGWQ